MPRLPLSALAVAASLTLLAACATTAPPAAMQSVVSVLPLWPEGTDGPPPLHPERQVLSEGSGVAILPGGFIATNLHVVRDATSVRIRLSDGRVIPVDMVGHDVATDLALLKAPLDLPVLEANQEPGLATRVCAIGNQFGLGLSITCGVVSAMHRTGTGFNPVEDFVQTDAAVNPGASGGALVDRDGRLVGLVSAIFSKSAEANIGVNFATSVALVLRVAEDLRTQGYVTRTIIGLRLAELPPEDLAAGAGAHVVDTVRNGPAARAGIRAGDIVTSIGARSVGKPADLTSAIALRRPGDTVAVTLRRNGRPLTVKVTVTAKPATTP